MCGRCCKSIHFIAGVFCIMILACYSIYFYIGCTYHDIRLYGGSTSTSGMVQLCDANGGWKAACDYRWGCSESIVACHQLGYPGGIYYMYMYNNNL